jgi:hypothetical protein
MTIIVRAVDPAGNHGQSAGADPSGQREVAVLIVRRASACAAITASKKTGRPVDERVKGIAETR